MILEDYAKAKAQVLEGLSRQPFEEDLQEALMEVTHHLVGSRGPSPAPSQSTPPSTKR